MQDTSQTYKTLLAAGAPKEVRARIYRSTNAYNTYGQAQIVSATTRAAMIDRELSIGNCIAKELHLVLTNFAGFPAIPRMAKIVMEFRLNDGTTQSEWLPKGTFFIDTRAVDYNGVLTIDAYDPMLKTEQSFTKAGNQGLWPRSDVSVVQTIATAMGVSIDERTTAIMTKGYQIGYPGIELEDGTPQYSQDGAMSMRQVLGYVGSMYGGNWVVTDENKLRLIVLGDIPPGPLGLLVNEAGDYIVMGGFRIRVSR